MAPTSVGDWTLIFASPSGPLTPGNICGNGVVDPGEQCDDGPLGSPICTPQCTFKPAVCGDGFVQHGELCDDGNKTPGDGCENDCTPTACPGVTLTATDRWQPFRSYAAPSGTSDGSVLYRGTVLGDRHVYQGGGVLVANGTISCAGCNCAPTSGSAASHLRERRHLAGPDQRARSHHLSRSAAAADHRAIRAPRRLADRRRLACEPHLSSTTTPPSIATQQWGELRQIMAGTTRRSRARAARRTWMRNLDKESQNSTTSASSSGSRRPRRRLARPQLRRLSLRRRSSNVLTSGCSYPTTPSRRRRRPDATWLGHVSEGINAGAENEAGLPQDRRHQRTLFSPHSALIHGVAFNATDWKERRAGRRRA